MSTQALEVRVKVADYAVRKGPHVIATIGLGSCVAIALCCTAASYTSDRQPRIAINRQMTGARRLPKKRSVAQPAR